MHRVFSYLLLIFPILTFGANVFVWNFDPLDVFYDPEVGDTIDCSYWLEQSLSANGHSYDIGVTPPTNLNNYDAVFVTLGWYRC